MIILRSGNTVVGIYPDSITILSLNAAKAHLSRALNVNRGDIDTEHAILTADELMLRAAGRGEK